MSTTTNQSDFEPRPSHQLPSDIFDAILALEAAARDAATYYTEAQLDTGKAPEGAALEYLRRVFETGAKRDDLAALLLPRLAAGEVVNVRYAGTAS